MKNFEIVIGVEVHAVLNTNTKMFSYAKNTHYAKPNNAVAWMDLALPGILPQPNKKAIEKGIILADALKMKINYQNIQFDRKNYFYVDLPKGFQITQQYYPIGTDGKIILPNKKEIIIERIHLEEDTAKKINVDNKLWLDYNRSGIPLVEIVTKPCLHSAEDTYLYLSKLKQILIFKGISDAKMEDGSMRVDVNISIRPYGINTYGNKVEIKNINSLNNVKKAIDFEIKRQIECILTNQEIKQETRRFNDNNNETEFIRDKTNAIDYRYITEPNIINFQLTKKDVEIIIKNAPASIDDIKNKLHDQFNFNEQQINNLMDNYFLYKLFNYLFDNIKQDPIQIYHWINNELIGIVDKNNLKLEILNTFQLEQLAFLLKKVLITKEINTKQAKNLLIAFFDNNKPFEELIKECGYVQITDEKTLENILHKIMNDNQSMLDQYEERPERVEKFFIGMVMKETNAQANPVITMKILKKLLKMK